MSIKGFGEKALIATAVGFGLGLAGRAIARARRRIDLAGKVCFVTGGSRGLGLVLARQLVDEGARVAICARDQAELDRAESDLRSRHGQVLAIRCDVTSRDEVEEAVREVVDHFGGIDVLINNAGTITVGPMESMTIDDYEQAMATHFWGPLHTTLAVLPHMKRGRGGRIANISSVGGKIAVPHLLPYVASKFALTGFSEGLRGELKKDRIYVTTVCPGLMRTGSPRNASFKGQHRAEYTWFALGDSLPLTSMNADRAAEQVIEAVRYGDAEVVLSIQAKMAVKLYSLFPEIGSEINALMEKVLPSPGSNGRTPHLGKESETALTQSFLTSLTKSAARLNNEMG